MYKKITLVVSITIANLSMSMGDPPALLEDHDLERDRLLELLKARQLLHRYDSK